MKKGIVALLIGIIMAVGCAKEESMVLEPEKTISNNETVTENVDLGDFILPEYPDETYFEESAAIDIFVAESGSEPDMLIDGEWVFDMDSWAESPYPDYVKLDYALYNESLASNEEVEALYTEQIDPVVNDFLRLVFNTAGGVDDYTEQVMQFCVASSDTEKAQAFHHYYDQLDFSYETYKNSLIYYYSDNTLTVNGLAVMSSSGNILQNHQRLHYIVPFTLGFINIDGKWMIDDVHGFNELYYGDTVQTYTNESNTIFVVMGHKLIDFDLMGYLVDLYDNGTDDWYSTDMEY